MTPPPELHRPLALDRIGQTELRHRVEADAAECVAIAARLRIPAVLSLACNFVLRRRGERVDAQGSLRAMVVRECVVSLEPFEVAIQEVFDIRFVPPGTEEADDDDPLAIDELPFEGVAVDLGEAAVEQLALALDPYPRRPEAVLPELAEPPDAPHPFAALARLHLKR